VVQPQACLLQVWEAVSQHSPAVQSAVVQQPATQVPPQQVWPPPQSVLVEQGQFSEVHC
jgi:hypothetical protein